MSRITIFKDVFDFIKLRVRHFHQQNDNRSGWVTEFVKQLLEELLCVFPDTSGQAASGGKEKNRE